MDGVHLGKDLLHLLSISQQRELLSLKLRRNSNGIIIRYLIDDPKRASKLFKGGLFVALCK